MIELSMVLYAFFFNDTATTEIYTLSLHDALPIYAAGKIEIAIAVDILDGGALRACGENRDRSEEHTSELQSLRHLVCRLLLEKKKKLDSNSQKTIHLSYNTKLHYVSSIAV